VILAIGQENAFPWIERDLGIAFDDHGMPKVDRTTMSSTRPGVFFGGDAAWGPENIIWAVEHGHQAAISIHNHCQNVPLTERPAHGMNLVSAKVGMHAWSYSNDYSPAPRTKMTHAELEERFAKLSVEVELGFTPEQTEAGLLAPRIGNTYSGAVLLGLCNILDAAEPGDRIFMCGYGSGAGSDAFDLTVTKNIAHFDRSQRLEAQLADTKAVDYATYAKFRGKIVLGAE
jgi:hypothetical protein